MKTATTWFRWSVVVFLMAGISAGCRSATHPVAFYTLSSIPYKGSPPAQASPGQDVVIGIGPVQFPDYLDRPQIVTRTSPNKLHISEFNRWAGRLDRNFVNMLAENLSILMPIDRVVVYPWKSKVSPSYEIALDVHQFEGEIGDSVTLDVTWAIRGKTESPELLYTKRSVIQEPAPGRDYDAMVLACSRAVAILSRQVSATINEMIKKRSTMPQ